MLKLSFEFRKGIFFIRFIGTLTKETYQQIEEYITSLITFNKFEYIVMNVNYLNKIDLTGLNYLIKIYYLAKNEKCNFITCDKSKIISTLLNNTIPNIETELEVL